MEEDQEPKHMCKLCNKSFPCGRSLGGHMRSHVIYPTDQEKILKKKKLPPVNSGGSNTIMDEAGYVLRENPKKTCRFKDLSSGDTLLHDKLCKECGKAFQSWKALFGHMKCHSDKITHCRVDEQESWTSADQSDNGTANLKRKKRSSRIIKMCNTLEVAATTTTSSSISFDVNASSSISEIEQEQEEVAMCLIMLSKDVSHWGSLNSVGESSENGSELKVAQSFTKIKVKESMSNGDEIVKYKTIREKGMLDSALEIETELGDSGNLEEGKLGGLVLNEKLKSKAVEGLKIQAKMENNLIKKSESDEKAEMGSKKHSSSKRKVLDLLDSEQYKKDCDNKSKFECASCNKAFNSFQALGGHRASHKKMKGCFGLKIDNGENIIVEANQKLSPNPTTDNNSSIGYVSAADTSNGTKKITKGGSHECPICFRVFSSGQALGGHKRSHLIADAKNIQSTSGIAVQKPVSEIRDFLDLNLPAPVEEDASSSGLGFSPWWIGSNKKHEPLLGLL